MRKEDEKGPGEEVLTNSDSVLESIFNQFHKATNSVTAVQGSVQMGKVIFQEWESGRKKTEREYRGGKKETGIERKKTKCKRERRRGSERDRE